MAQKTLTLIDGSGFIFRAFHALPPMTRPDGTPINAVYGYCTMLNKLLGESETQQIAVIFDAGRKTFRNEIYQDYKAHRPPPPEKLVPQFPLVRDATRAYGLVSIEAPNYEADDLIASYAKAALQRGMTVRIVSSDKDLMQLLRDGVSMYDPLKGVPIGAEEVMKKFCVAPDKVIDVQALMGDSTDNVPGVPGIGVKTAAELINTYGSLENLLREAPNIKQPKRRDALIQNAELARVSLKLVTLDPDVPLPMPIEELVWKKDHRAELSAFFLEQGFKSLLARLEKASSRLGSRKIETAPALAAKSETLWESPIPNPESSSYECIQTVERLDWWIEAAKAQGYVAIDTETNSLTACIAKLVGVSLALAPGKACYIPVGHVDPNEAPDTGGFTFSAGKRPKQLGLKLVVEKLRSLLCDPGTLKIAHNLKYDAQVLGQHDLIVEPYDDTMLLSYVLAAGKHGHGLDELAVLHCQHEMISYDEVTGTG
ncbi:MAG: 5'-3' exonuclease H3TH domain-containing protein, partial [Alphaproteobacteria bacterium]|nr:5'-3' exonuclease H3TH domain-containing protein [Alphaproteobacteria bacterium]